MFTPKISINALDDRLAELLADPDFVKLAELIAKEVMRHWSLPYKAASGFVLAAIGEPATLTQVHAAWRDAQHRQRGKGLAKVIVRRRVIDLLRKDARPAHHCSSSEAADDVQPSSFHDLVERTPQTQLELRQLIQLVRAAVACFATQGSVQRRQAQLLQRYALEEASYSELSTELACTESALRVRVHKAMIALRKHIQECHLELEGLLERDARTVRLDHRTS